MPHTPETENVRPAYLDSIEAAASHLQLQPVVLSSLKAAGAPGFRSGRVYLGEVELYVTQHPEIVAAIEAVLDKTDGVTAEIQAQRLRRITFENDVAEGKYMAKAQIIDAFVECATDLKQTLRYFLEDRLPDVCAQKTREELVEIGRQIFDDVCDRLSRSEPAKLAAGNSPAP